MKKTTLWPVRIIRLLRLLLHVVSGIIQSIAYPYFPRATQHYMMQKWASGVLKILNIKWHTTGEPPDQIMQQRILFVANHVSWLDVCLVMAICPTRFVAKSEIRNWPIIGFLCKNVGTLFIERSKRSDTLRINRAIGSALIAGERVCIFPEAGTSDGRQIHHFHASLMQSAIDVGALLYPVAIRYLDGTGHICRDAAYTDISLMTSLQRIISQSYIEAVLDWSEAIHCEGKNRRELARLSEHAIASSLSLSSCHKESEKPAYLPNA